MLMKESPESSWTASLRQESFLRDWSGKGCPKEKRCHELKLKMGLGVYRCIRHRCMSLVDDL